MNSTSTSNLDERNALQVLACFRLSDIGDCMDAVEKLLFDRQWDKRVLLSENITKHLSVAVFWIFHIREIIDFSLFLSSGNTNKVLQYISQSPNEHDEVASSIRHNVTLYIFQQVYSDDCTVTLRETCHDILSRAYLNEDNCRYYCLLSRNDLWRMQHLNACIACCHAEEYVSNWYEEQLLRLCRSHAVLALHDCISADSPANELLRLYTSSILVRVLESILSDENQSSFDYSSLYARADGLEASRIPILSLFASPSSPFSNDMNTAIRSVAFAAISNERAAVLQRCIALADIVYDARHFKTWIHDLTDDILADAKEVTYFSFLALTCCELIPLQSLHTLKILCQALHPHRAKASDAIETFIHIARDRIREMEYSSRDLFSSSEDTNFSLSDVTVDRVQHWACTVRKTSNLPVAIIEMCNFMGRNAATSLLLAMKNLIRRNSSLRSECVDIVVAMKNAKIVSFSDANSFLAYARGDVQDHHTEIIKFTSVCLARHQLASEESRVMQVVKLLLNVQDAFTREEGMNNSQMNAIETQWKSHTRDCCSNLTITRQQSYVITSVITQSLMQTVASFIALSPRANTTHYHNLLYSFLCTYTPTSPFLMVLISLAKVQNMDSGMLKSLAYCIALLNIEVLVVCS